VVEKGNQISISALVVEPECHDQEVHSSNPNPN
jgi:hypothetical protein